MCSRTVKRLVKELILHLIRKADYSHISWITDLQCSEPEACVSSVLQNPDWFWLACSDIFGEVWIASTWVVLIGLWLASINAFLAVVEGSWWLSTNSRTEVWLICWSILLSGWWSVGGGLELDDLLNLDTLIASLPRAYYSNQKIERKSFRRKGWEWKIVCEESKRERERERERESDIAYA